MRENEKEQTLGNGRKDKTLGNGRKDKTLGNRREERILKGERTLESMTSLKEVTPRKETGIMQIRNSSSTSITFALPETSPSPTIVTRPISPSSASSDSLSFSHSSSAQSMLLTPTVSDASSEDSTTLTRKRLLSRSDPGRLSPHATPFVVGSSVDAVLKTPPSMPKNSHSFPSINVYNSASFTPSLMDEMENNMYSLSSLMAHIPPKDLIPNSPKVVWYLANVRSNVTKQQVMVCFPTLPGNPIIQTAYQGILTCLYLEEKYPSHVSYSIPSLRQIAIQQRNGMWQFQNPQGDPGSSIQNPQGDPGSSIQNPQEPPRDIWAATWNADQAHRFTDLMMWDFDPCPDFSSLHVKVAMKLSSEIQNSYSMIFLSELKN
jgi:hypothetical protein